MSRHVLIVDDDTITLNLLQLILRSVGFETTIAKNGIEALELLEQFLPDVVLLDIQMPLMNGLEVCRRIRNNKRLAQLPVILLTTNAKHSKWKEAKAAGANKYLLKPIKRETLTNEINELLADRQP